MTAIELRASDLESAAFFLGHFLSTTEADKLTWAPKAEGHDSKGRSAMDVVSECVFVNYRTAAVLAGQVYEGEPVDFGSVDEARAALAASGKAVADAVRAHDESVFSQKFQMPWGEVEGDFLIKITATNMFYHIGQINYIQLLYGDEVFHLPR